MIEVLANATEASGLTTVTGLEVCPGQNELLSRFLSPPNHGFMMAEAAQHAPGMAARAQTVAEAGGLAVLLRANVAWEADVPGALALAGAAHWPGLEPRSGGLRLAAHEALVNALMYGCLNVAPHVREDTKGWLDYTAATVAALADPERGGLPVLVTVEEQPSAWVVRVEDPGPGFEPPPAFIGGGPTVPPPGAVTSRGRGLMLMRAICDRVEWSDGGRVVLLTFNRTVQTQREADVRARELGSSSS